MLDRALDWPDFAFTTNIKAIVCFFEQMVSKITGW